MGAYRAHIARRGSAVKYFASNDANKAKLRRERSFGFEDIAFHIERGDVVDILEHPNPERYAGQRICVVRREGLPRPNAPT